MDAAGGCFLYSAHRHMRQEGRAGRVDDEPHAMQEPELGRTRADLGSCQKGAGCQVQGRLEGNAALGTHYAAHCNR